MFQRHVSNDLAAFIDGALTPEESARIQSHLGTCAECRATSERFRATADVLGQVPLVEAPSDIWRSLEIALDNRERNVSHASPSPVTLRRWPGQYALATAAMLVLATSLVLWQIRRDQSAVPASTASDATKPEFLRWDVIRLDGPGGAHRLSIGDWIETTAAAKTLLQIGEIGTVAMEPNTRMQLLTASANEHRLSLARGMISAKITAPPRLFFVETPSSTVVDLGCAYTMQVDDDGVGRLRVTAGWASLEWGTRESLVPAGASCPTRPDVGPGTPFFDDASDRLQEALLAFDFADGGSAAIDTILRESRARDTLTLWHLLSRAAPRDRARIVDRLIEFAPLPRGVTRENAIALDAETLKRWREELAWDW